LPQELIDIPVPLPSGVLAYYRVPQKMSGADFKFYQSVLVAYEFGLTGSIALRGVDATEPKKGADGRLYPAQATWSNKDHDVQVTITGVMGEKDGRKYYQSSTGTGIPGDELIFLPPG
jgi:hypothetical protein